MPLTLVTGPANAAKAGAVLGPLRERIDEEPVLVVPAFEDVEHNQRELAERGAIFGARVLRSGQLFGLIAERAGLTARRADPLTRELHMAAAAQAAGLGLLAPSAQRPGFVRAAVRLVSELEQAMAEPPRLTQALRAWAGDGPRRPYAEEIAELYRRYREGLEAAGLLDEDLFAWRALDALRRAPAAWGTTPVFFYGFDDFTPLELDALETLSAHAGADVTVSLPYEPGRVALRAVAPVRESVAALADRIEHLEATDDHYDPGARAALYALERGLFADDAAPADPGAGVRAHLCGGRRAEIELCAAEVLKLLRAGVHAGQVAVVVRDPAAYASTVEQVFAAYGIRFSIERSLPLRQTGIGRGLLALLRAASPAGSAEDLLTWLRTPGLVRATGRVDELEARARQEGARSAAAARALWDTGIGPFELDDLDRVAAALDDPPALLAELGRRLEWLFSAPHARAADVLESHEADDARAFVAAHAAVRELHAAVTAGPVTIDAVGIAAVLGEVAVRLGARPQPDRVQVASPLDIRARRFDAVFVLGLQEGEFPRPGRPEAFLSDADRRELARASGLVLGARENTLDRERYLFYVCASRAERLLVLSARSSGEEGEAESQSFFLQDVERIFPGLRERARKRTLADVTWSVEDAPTAAEWDRAVARLRPASGPAPVGPLRSPEALAFLGARGPLSARALENYAGCPVKWLVEDVLRPVALEADPERMVQGAYAHKVLELTYRRLAERTASARVTEANLAEAEAILLAALEDELSQFVIAPSRARVRAALRRLEFQLLAHLRHEAEHPSPFEPEHLELRFGFEDDEHSQVELAGGVRVRGRIDRIDRHGDDVVVRDYKGGRADDYAAAKWQPKGRLQAALYMRVVEQLFGVRAVAGLYTPLGGVERRSRGLASAEVADDLAGQVFGTDVRDQGDFDGLRAWADSAIADAAQRMAAGELCSRADSCAYRGGCSHPSICRLEA